MQLQNKNRIAYYGALTLLFSYAEMLLPRILPFFRFGLGNIVILLALSMDFPSFLLLTVIKAFASSMLNGTLLSPFFVISLCQSVASGCVMYGLFRLKKSFLGLCGISIAGSTVSTLVQIGLSALYIGTGTLALTGPMLLFGLAAALVTAFAAQNFKIPEEAPLLSGLQQNQETSTKDKEPSTKNTRLTVLLSILLLLASAVCVLSMNNLILLSAALILAFIFQLVSGRKLLLLPHIGMWIFVILASLLSPSGKILFSLGKFNVTRGALLLGLGKALKLSAVSALSQCAAGLKPEDSTLAGKTLLYFNALLQSFRTAQGNIFSKIIITLQKTKLSQPENSRKAALKLPLTIIIFISMLALFLLNRLFLK